MAIVSCQNTKLKHKYLERINWNILPLKSTRIAARKCFTEIFWVCPGWNDQVNPQPIVKIWIQRINIYEGWTEIYRWKHVKCSPIQFESLVQAEMINLIPSRFFSSKNEDEWKEWMDKNIANAARNVLSMSGEMIKLISVRLSKQWT